VQTPGFVIDFILDRTFTPALDVFGLETVRMIDPSCGSGHFLLAAVSELFRLWQAKEPGTNPPALV
jgi:type I restriction-modification system DNA methylase subunit